MVTASLGAGMYQLYGGRVGGIWPDQAGVVRRRWDEVPSLPPFGSNCTRAPAPHSLD